MKIESVTRILEAQKEAHARFCEESPAAVIEIAQILADAIENGNKIILFGNGGSAADAQHVAAEIVGRFSRERPAWPAIALTTDTSILTAVSNDYGFDKVFVRQVEALAFPGDVVVGISTSGNSPNVLKALESANKLGAKTIGFTGGKGGRMPMVCVTCFIAPADVTARIQELHLAAWHAICELIEISLSGETV